MGGKSSKGTQSIEDGDSGSRSAGPGAPKRVNNINSASEVQSYNVKIKETGKTLLTSIPHHFTALNNFMRAVVGGLIFFSTHRCCTLLTST